MYSSRKRDNHLSKGVRRDIRFYKCVVDTRNEKEHDINFGALGQGV
jgi:hypothetical protein